MNPGPQLEAGSSADELRHAMGRFATGVTVVTSIGAAGEPVGTTANAVSSLSLDPPLLLVCLARSSLTLAAVRSQKAFVVNVLGERHAAVSATFARRGSRDAWDAVDHHPGATGAPRLPDALAALECSVERLLPGGDHEIVIGRVVGTSVGDDDHDPLLFYRGGHAGLGRR